jgi:hypothetical protein
MNIVVPPKGGRRRILAFFGDLVHEPEATRAKNKTGLALKEFYERVLGGIKMTMDTSNKNSGRHLLKFTEV